MTSSFSSLTCRRIEIGNVPSHFGTVTKSGSDCIESASQRPEKNSGLSEYENAVLDVVPSEYGGTCTTPGPIASSICCCSSASVNAHSKPRSLPVMNGHQDHS